MTQDLAPTHCGDRCLPLIRQLVIVAASRSLSKILTLSREKDRNLWLTTLFLFLYLRKAFMTSLPFRERVIFLLLYFF